MSATVNPAAFELLARANSGEGVKSGPIGLAVILLLCVAAYFLFKSMSKHLKKVREEFPADEQATPSQPPAKPKTPVQQADSAQPTETPPGPGSTP